MGSSDSHDAFTEPAENAPRHDDAFTQPEKDAPRGDDSFTQSFKDGLARDWSQICEIQFKFISRCRESGSFDDVDFYRYDGGFIKGAELRDCQTGCEILEKRGFHNCGFGSSFKDLKCGCKQFDEQFQFVNEENKPLSNVDYCITRADGMEVKGTTDNEGKTKRIKNTQKEMAIEKVEFFASKYTQPLCPQNRIPIGAVLADVALIDVKTTNVNVGSSVKKVTLKGESRPLTSGEIRLSEPVFKDSIKYGEVKVYRKELLPFGIQKRENNIMVPWGNLYCTERNFREDYSKENDETKIWFMHEMTHVWQHQLGYDVAMNGLVAAMKLKYKDNSIYEYDPITDKGKLLSNFNFEQQGELISHYFAAKYLWYADYLSSRPFYENILKDFLRNPKNAKLLPDKEASFFKG